MANIVNLNNRATKYNNIFFNVLCIFFTTPSPPPFKCVAVSL